MTVREPRLITPFQPDVANLRPILSGKPVDGMELAVLDRLETRQTGHRHAMSGVDRFTTTCTLVVSPLTTSDRDCRPSVALVIASHRLE